MILLIAAGVSLAAASVAVGFVVRRKQMHLWLAPYLKGVMQSAPYAKGPIHVCVCIADHYEPGLNDADLQLQRERVARWMKRYPPLASKHRDADGVPVQWTFFYPQEQYRFEHLDALAELRRRGYGDVEIHLHHHDDTSDNLRATLAAFARTLHDRHGLLAEDASGAVRYAFIHGNWALDNSGREGAWCGVNDELSVLMETGCYADLTFPSAPSETQPATINSIYYATDDPFCPKSHDHGPRVRAGGTGRRDELLMVQGPLTIQWLAAPWRVRPRIENGELSGDHPPSPRRADLWIRQHIHVEGRPDWIFVKLHTHGANEANTDALLGPAMEATLAHLESTYNDGRRYVLHYVTARQMVNIIKAAEAGQSGNPHRFREVGLVRAKASAVVA